MSKGLSLDAIARRLASIAASKPVGPIVHNPPWRPDVPRRAAIEAITRIAAEACGGQWDRPVPWRVLYRAVLTEGHSEGTIRRSVRYMGVEICRRGRVRMAYPPSMTKRKRDSDKTDPPTYEAAHDPVYESWAHEPIDLPDVRPAEAPEPAASTAEVPVCDPKRSRQLLGRAPLRRSTADRLVAQGARTVADAVALCGTLEPAEAARLLKYAAGK